MSATPTSGRRVLIIQPLPGIGDMIWHLPFIKAIVALEGDSQIDLLAIRRSMADQLFAANGLIADVLWIEDSTKDKGRTAGMLALARQLRVRQYDRVWVLHKNYRWALAALLAGIPERFGYGLGWQRLFLNRGHCLTARERSLHPIDQAIEYLKRNGVMAAEAMPELAVTPKSVSRIQSEFGQLPQPWIALGIGATDSRRQWSTEHFVTLTDRLLGQYGGTIFVIGGPAEAEMALTMHSQVAADHAARVVLVQTWPIPDIAALLKACRGFVGNDSGMLHLSAAVGTPSIGLFGVRYQKIDTYRLADERRNIFPVFPQGGAEETNVSYLHRITVEDVISMVRQCMVMLSDRQPLV